MPVEFKVAVDHVLQQVHGYMVEGQACILFRIHFHAGFSRLIMGQFGFKLLGEHLVGANLLNKSGR